MNRIGEAVEMALADMCVGWAAWRRNVWEDQGVVGAAEGAAR